MSAKRKKDEARKLSSAEISQLKDLSWEDYEKELAAAREEERTQYGDLTEEDKAKNDAYWNKFLSEYATVARERVKAVNNIEVPSGLDSEMQNVKIKISEVSIGMPDNLSQLNPRAENDPFYYMPHRVRHFVEQHDFMIEVMSFYTSNFMMQPEKNEFKSLKALIHDGISCGLAFRKMYLIKGNYAIVIFTFSDRIDETMVEDYRANAEMMTFDESTRIQKKIDETQARIEAEGNDDDTGYTKLGADRASDIKFQEYETTISFSEAGDYIYSHASVAVLCAVKKETLPALIKDERAMLIAWERYPDIQCKFHNLYILPSN